MTSRTPDISAWEGHVVPGVINPNIRRKWFTNIPYGGPIKEQPVSQPPVTPDQGGAGTQPQSGGAPHPVGDEAHAGALAKIKQMMVSQTAQQKTIPAFRDWR